MWYEVTAPNLRYCYRSRYKAIHKATFLMELFREMDMDTVRMVCHHGKPRTGEVIS